MNFDVDQKTLLLSWGATVSLGWLTTAIMGALGMTIGKVLAAWMILMAVPILSTLMLYYKGKSNAVFNFWAVVVTVLMVENILAPAGLDYYSYFHLWYGAAVLGFYYTSRKVPSPANRVYRIATALSGIGLAAVFIEPFLAVPLGIILQGGPMLYDWKGMKG